MDPGRLIHRLLIGLQDFILRHPWRVLAASGALLILAAVLGAGVELRSSRSDLAPQDDPDQRRYEKVAGEVSGMSDLVACVSAAPGAEKSPEELRSFADALASRFGAEPEVAQVFHKVDLEWFALRGLWLAPPGQLRRAAGALRRGGTLEALGSLDSLADLNRLVADRLESGMDSGSPPPEEEAMAGARGILSLLEWERAYLEEPGGRLERLGDGSPLLRMAGERSGMAPGGYLATRDGGTLFLMVSPRGEDDSLPARRRFVGSLREAAESLREGRPGFEVAFTGRPAMSVEEMGIVRRDTWITAGVASAGVILLTLFVFRWRFHSLLVLASIGTGVIWALGAVRLELGYLNMLTSSFISTLVGVGVAYSIHPVSEYELQGAHTGDPDEAVREAWHATGAAVATGGVTTAAAFFSILLMNFRGFSELGLVAGVGILLCLAAALVALPAMVVLYGRRRGARRRREGPRHAAVDRIWVERGAGKVCAFPKSVTAAGLVLTAIFIYTGRDPGFDISLLNMLPRDAESVRHLEMMLEKSDFSPNMNIVVADQLSALREARERAREEPAISRFDSALEFLPADREASRAALEDLSGLLDRARLAGAADPASREELAASLRNLEGALSRAAEEAFAGGLGRVAGPLEEARAAAEETAGWVESAPAESVSAWRSGQERLLKWARRALEDLREAAATEAPAPESLPPGIAGRFITGEGRYVALMHAAGDIFDQEFLDEFVAASRRVAPDVTGFPVVFRTMSRRITSGFYRAAAVAAAAVFLILLADFRSLRETVLALVPLGMGVLWMRGGMGLMGIEYNFANLVAVPLIIGVGIDNGVHVIHRIRREGKEGMGLCLRHTGRAILISSLTTMIGFGSLSLASHRGLASLGIILLLGVGACLISSMVILPNMLVATGRVHR